MLIKKYCFWTVNKNNNNNCYTHPNTDNEAQGINPDFTFIETGHFKNKNPALDEYVGIVEYDDSKDFNQYKSDLNKYQITEKTEEEINAFLSEIYGGSVTVNNFVFS